MGEHYRHGPGGSERYVIVGVYSDVDEKEGTGQDGVYGENGQNK